MGWETKTGLKVPQAVKGDVKILFRPQAVYLHQHSMMIDIRDMPIAVFLHMIHVELKMREKWAR